MQRKPISGTFRHRVYDNAEIISPEQLTTFSDHRFLLDCPDHVSLPHYFTNLQSYFDRFELGIFVKLGSWASYFGAFFVMFYRLIGTFRSVVAPEIAKTELMQTIKRRRGSGKFFFGVMPMAFYGVVNLIAYLMDLVGVVLDEESVVAVEDRAAKVHGQVISPSHEKESLIT